MTVPTCVGPVLSRTSLMPSAADQQRAPAPGVPLAVRGHVLAAWQAAVLGEVRETAGGVVPRLVHRYAEKQRRPGETRAFVPMDAGSSVMLAPGPRR
jgi:hypothetical protein